MERLTGLERIYDEDYDYGESDEDIRGSDSDEDDDQNDDFEAQMQAELGKKVWNFYPNFRETFHTRPDHETM